VAIAATFLVVVVKAAADLLGINHVVNEVVIGLLFAAGMAFAGARYGHQHAKKSTTPRILEIRLFLIQFALFLFMLSALQFSVGEVMILNQPMSIAGVVVPVLVIAWLVYWCGKNVLSISEKQANMVGTKRSELLTLCAGLLLAPFLLLIPGFALAEVFGFDPMIILSVFQFAPIMSATLPTAFSIRRMIGRSD